MVLLPKKPEWALSESLVTSDSHYWNRRQFLKASALTTGLLFSGPSAWTPSAWADDAQYEKAARGMKPGKLYPAKKNKDYLVKGQTKQKVATRYNNFYEFTTEKSSVWKQVGKFSVDPWSIKIHGLVNKPMTLSVWDLLKKIPLEERIYRFRCVEAWAMVVPWTGFPLASLLKLVEPKSSARYLRFVSAKKPKEMPGMRAMSYYPWPYKEGLRIDEAKNPLAFIATGIYGAPLPKQQGAPIRLVMPWKYGFKSAKSIVEVEFTKTQPKTFWNGLAPEEYSFLANVNPKVPHPRWSQAKERMIGTDTVRATELYNGYAKQVASLYKKPKKSAKPKKTESGGKQSRKKL